MSHGQGKLLICNMTWKSSFFASKGPRISACRSSDILRNIYMLVTVCHEYRKVLFFKISRSFVGGLQSYFKCQFKNSQWIELFKSKIFHDVNNWRIRVHICDWFKKTTTCISFDRYLFCRNFSFLVNNTFYITYLLGIYMYIYCNWNRRGKYCIVYWPQRLFIPVRVW